MRRSLRSCGRSGELAGWIAASTLTPFATPDLPRSLVRPDPNDTSPLASYSPARQQLAANADRDSLGEADRPDLNQVFADRLGEALGVYREAVARARAAPSGDAALDELLAWLTAAARRAAPTLIGFARVADRREGELHLPPASVEGARLARGRLRDARGGADERGPRDAAVPRPVRGRGDQRDVSARTRSSSPTFGGLPSRRCGHTGSHERVREGGSSAAPPPTPRRRARPPRPRRSCGAA